MFVVEKVEKVRLWKKWRGQLQLPHWGTMLVARSVLLLCGGDLAASSCCYYRWYYF